MELLGTGGTWTPRVGFVMRRAAGLLPRPPTLIQKLTLTGVVEIHLYIRRRRGTRSSFGWALSTSARRSESPV